MSPFSKQGKNLIFITLVLSIISLSNFWVYWIYKKSFLLGSLTIIETVLFFFLIYFEKVTKFMLTAILIILLIESTYLLTGNFDKNIFSPSIVDSIKIRQRQQFYNLELGRIYGNKLGIYYFDNLKLVFNKLNSNLFSNLDLSIYFSPRVLFDRDKFSLILSPLFIIGFLSLLSKSKKTLLILLIYLVPALSVASFINVDSTIHPILMFPFMSVCLTVGLIELLKKLTSMILHIKT